MSYAFYSKWVLSSHSAINGWLMKCCWDGCPSRSAIQFGRVANSRKTPSCPNFFHFTIIENILLLGTLQPLEIAFPRHHNIIIGFKPDLLTVGPLSIYISVFQVSVNSICHRWSSKHISTISKQDAHYCNLEHDCKGSEHFCKCDISIFLRRKWTGMNSVVFVIFCSWYKIHYV